MAPRSRAEFKIAILCALPLEVDAIEALFDEHYGELDQIYAKQSGDANIYKTGRVGNHHVVLVYMPGKGYRNSAAITSSLRISFTGVNLALLMGICGGVPFSPDKSEIVLGDVIFSDFVIEYDSGRQYPHQFERERDPKVNLGKPSREIATLLKRLETLRTKREIQNKAIQNLHFLQGIENTRWHYPGVSEDILYEATYRHKHYQGTSKGHCTECFSGQDSVCQESLKASCNELGCAGTLVERERLKSTVSPDPEIHVGSIGCANAVLKSGEHREKLVEREAVIGFEMEGPGVWDNLPCVIIKGVCDYADSHKSDKWQNYAAATAASYTKAFLEYWVSPSRKAPTSPKSSSMPPIQKPTLTPQQRRRYLESLKFEEIDNRYEDIKTAHYKTCRWLLSNSKYQKWFDVNDFSQLHGLLWIKGNPGTGKSTLMKFAFESAIKEAERAGSTAVIAFFFNDRGGELEKSVVGMYRSLLFQVLKKIPDLDDILHSSRLTTPDENELPNWNHERLKATFRHTVKKLGPRSLICFIDALDECDEDEAREMAEFFEELGDLAIESQIRFRVCFSSRHHPHIHVEKEIELVIDSHFGHDQDIANYVQSTLTVGTKTTDLKGEVIKKSCGIFLWAYLVVKILNKEYARGRMRELQRRLQETPKGLDDLFESILTRDIENIDELSLCLQLILFTRQPLTREELYFALRAGIEPQALKARNLRDDPQNGMDHYILSVSKGLVEIRNDKKSGQPTAQFIHESVKDFLLERNGLKKISPGLGNKAQGHSHEQLKICCVNYLKLGFSIFTDTSKSLPSNILSWRYPFLQYSISCVLYHADKAQGSGISQATFLLTFPLSNWVKLDNELSNYKSRSYSPNVSLLYILAERNLSNLIKIHPSITSCLEVESEIWETPFLAALITKSEEAVQAFVESLECNLLSRNQQREICDKLPWSSLKGLQNNEIIRLLTKQNIVARIVELGNEKVFSWFLKIKSISPEQRDSDGRMILSHVAEIGNENMCRVLLQEENIGVHSEDFKGRNPLSYAAAKGKETLVRILLDMDGVEVDLQDSNGRTPFLYAARNGHDSVLRLLFETGKVNINVQDINGRTPFSHATTTGNHSTVKLLMETCLVDIDLQDTNGRTPFLYAARNGHDAMVRLLFETGKVNINVQDINRRTPLSYAAINRHHSTIKLLIKMDGVDVDSRDSVGRTPLSYAAENGADSTLRLLLKTGVVNIDSPDKEGRTPLSYAAGNGADSTLRLLLKTGVVNIDSPDKEGRTPLSYAAGNGKDSTLKLLLETGVVNIDSPDKEGRTPLSYAAGNGKDSTLKLLLETGVVNIDSPDKKGRTPFSYAAKQRSLSNMRLLFDTGKVNVNSQDIHGRTPFSLIVDLELFYRPPLNDRLDVLRALLTEYDADINSKDKAGRTPLSYALESRQYDLISFLRARGAISEFRRE